MDVRCERCRAQYVFDDEQVTASGLTVQCTNCGHLFKVKKKELVVTVPVKPDEVEGAPLPATAAAPRPGGSHAAATAAAPAPEKHEPERPREWRVRQANGNIFTFRELTTLQKWIIEQKVARDDEISLAGDQWKRLGNIAELASFFQVVEAAERGKAQPALTPVGLQSVPAITPMPMPAVPVYGVAIQTPLYPAPPPPAAAPPPPSGFPPPSFAVPPPPPPPRREATTGSELLPPPVHEVDLGPDVEAAPPRKGRGRRIALSLVLLGAAGAGAYLALPALFRPRPPEPLAVPITIELHPEAKPGDAAAPAAEPGPAAAPALPPVPAPEPVPEPGLHAPPEPLKAPAAAAKPAPRGPKALLADADRLREKGACEAALDAYGRVLAAEPDNANAQSGRGLCYLDLERYGPAEASFEAALRLDPRDPDALLGLAETFRSEGKNAEAIRQYERYLAEHPEGEEAEVARNALANLRK